MSIVPHMITLFIIFFFLLETIFAKTYIISLTSYKPPEQHAILINSLLHLTPPTNYHLLPRPTTPTDFLLLETPDPNLLTHLTHSQIRYITPNRQTRHPLSVLPKSYKTFQHPLTNHKTHPITVAIFDTGISPTLPVASAHDWTPENTTIDKVGHGTFVASLLTSSNPHCPGLVPNTNLHIFRVFTTAQISYTSWFLDAFNYALHTGIDILNLSIGGPDFADAPFVDKVNELTAHGVVVISAIGNDGPLWGSLNNPADMMDVIGVGGYDNNAVASFSSRGMTTHGLPDGYGRVKPDILASSRALQAQSINGKCTRLSGTSVASPVVAAAVVRLISAVHPAKRHLANPASIKRALLAGARLVHASVYEQGAGLIHLPRSIVEMHTIVQESLDGAVKAIAFPSFYDLRVEGCSYMWPHCAQPLFNGQLPTVLNVTLINPAGVEGRVGDVLWKAGKNAELITLVVSKPQRFWPWAGGMGIHLTAVGIPDRLTHVEGVLKVTIESVHEGTESIVEIPIMADVIPPPPRQKRLLWDVFHSIRYPPGYVPRDGLAEKKDMLDWLGDHPHTNFHKLFRKLRHAGFYIDVLDRSLECLDIATVAQYGGILLLDSEDFFSDGEIAIVQDLVKNHGTALIVAAEWYNLDIMREIRFEDDNTRSWWTPVVAGGNVPALNNLLRGFGVAFGDAVLSGDIKAGQTRFRFESGVPLVAFPAGGQILHSDMLRPDGERVIEDGPQSRKYGQIPALGVTKAGRGAVVAYGDTHCIDTIYTGARCYDFFVEVIKQAINECTGKGECQAIYPEFRVLSRDLTPTSNPLRRLAKQLPKDLFDVFRPHSRVFNQSTTACKRHELYQPAQIRLNGPVNLPLQRRVDPVVAGQSYLGDMSGLSDSIPLMSTGFDVVAAVRFLVSSAAIRIRGIIAILVGLFLILLSFSMYHPSRAKGKKVRFLRKRLSRYSYSGPGSHGFRGADLHSYPFSRFLSITSSED